MQTDEKIPNVDLPSGEKGKWKIEKFEVTKKQADLENLRASIGTSSRRIHPGIYTRLMRNGQVVMSDTPEEKRDHLQFVAKAHGHVLINGLGLGMCVVACLRKKEVTRVTVVELDQDVIDLVAPTLFARWGGDSGNLSDARLQIIKDDCLTRKWDREEWWHCVWHDIWDNICGDNWESMKLLHRKFGHKCGMQDSWCRWLVQEHSKRG